MEKTNGQSNGQSNGQMNGQSATKFYKNPAFIVIIIYVIFIFGTYYKMSDSIKNSYVFADKFRDSSGHISWLNILTFPYDPSTSNASFIYSGITPPIIWYLVVFTLLFTSVININRTAYQAYFYSVMFSYLLLLILFTLHIIIFNIIISPKNQEIEVVLDDEDNVKKTYDSFYRTQWVLLFTLSPIYVYMTVFIGRLLSK